MNNFANLTSMAPTKITKATIEVNGIRSTIRAPQDQATPYQWECLYSAIPDSLWDDMDLKEPPREAWRALRRLIRDMDPETNWACIGSYRQLGMAAGRVGLSMDASRTWNMVDWLEQNDYVVKSPSGIFVNPSKVFRGGGTRHKAAMEDWRRWQSARRRGKQQAGAEVEAAGGSGPTIEPAPAPAPALSNIIILNPTERAS